MQVQCCSAAMTQRNDVGPQRTGHTQPLLARVLNGKTGTCRAGNTSLEAMLPAVPAARTIEGTMGNTFCASTPVAGCERNE